MSAADHISLRKAFRANLFAHVTDASRFFLPEGRSVETERTEPGQAWFIAEFMRTFAADQFIGGLCEEQGQMIYRVVVPSGTGTEIPEAKTREIADAFGAAKPITTSAGQVITEPAVRGGAQQYDEARWAYPVTINWRFYAA